MYVSGPRVQERKMSRCVGRDGGRLRRTDGGHLRARDGSRGVGIEDGSGEATRRRRQCPCFLASERDEQRNAVARCRSDLRTIRTS